MGVMLCSATSLLPSSDSWIVTDNWGEWDGVRRRLISWKKNEVSLLAAIANAGRYRGEIIWQTHIFTVWN